LSQYFTTAVVAVAIVTAAGVTAKALSSYVTGRTNAKCAPHYSTS